MHAYLITNGTPTARRLEIKKRLLDAHVSTFDTTYLRLIAEEEHIGIEAVRAFKKQLLLAPQHSPLAAGIIEDAHTLTTEAQNALLKLLEEPPPHAIIFSETENRELLLPTIISRCEIVHITEIQEENKKENDETIATINSILTASAGEKLTIIESVARDRSQAKSWTLKALSAIHKHLLKEYSAGSTSQNHTKHVLLARLLGDAYQKLGANVNPRLVLDTLFLAI